MTSKSSSFWKAVTYRAGSIALTFLIGYIFFGKIEQASAFTLVGHCATTLWYLAHAKLWEIGAD